MPAFTPQEIHFLFERAFNIGDVEAILTKGVDGTKACSGQRRGHKGVGLGSVGLK
jgi:hypothetical protein